MLVAREQAEYQILPQIHEYRPVRTRKVSRVKTETKVFYCFIVVLTLGLAFMLASKQAQVASAGYDILALQKQLQELNTENQLLQSKVAELKSLHRIEYVATVKMGMQKPEMAAGVQFVPVQYPKTGTGDVGMASAAGTDDKDGIASAAGIEEKTRFKRSPFVQALARLINS